MSDLISRQVAIELIHNMYPSAPIMRSDRERWKKKYKPYIEIEKALEMLPSAQPERTEYIPDTKAVRSKRDCVDLAERVDATFYDQEYEEWTQKTVTIADVLDSVCDEYTILPSA